MIKILKDYPIDVVGDYHSHSPWGEKKAKPVPSGDDVADMNMGQISIILALNPKKRKQKWIKLSNGSLSGTIGDFHICISAFTLISEYRFKRVEIVCPSATGIRL